MTPISTKTTDIDEVIILRGKRLASNVRGRYSDSAARKRERDMYIGFLEDNPLRESSILRFVGHMRKLFADGTPDQNNAIEKGYF